MAAERDARTPFEKAVAVHPAGQGLYRAVIDGAWDGPAAPNGGVLAAIMVRAAQSELGSPAPAPRTISVQFLEPPGHGPVEIGVEILRGGKRVAVCDVRMREADRLVAQMTLVCSAARAQETTLRPAPLEAPPPESVEVADIEGSSGGPPMFTRVETRPIFGSAIFAGSQDAVTGGWLALRDDPAPLDAARLCALCDLWWPAIYARLTSIAGAPTLQLTVYLRSTEPEVHGPVLARFETRHLQEGHIEERGELWSSDGRLLAQSQQLALLVMPERGA
jgi:acyl-CoA thioesterase